MADVFISYKKIDRARVEPLVAALEREGFSVWWDYEIESGDKWLERIVEEVISARCLVGFWTDNALNARKLFVASAKDGINYLEIEHKSARKNRIVGAIMDRDAIPLQYDDVQNSDLTDWVPGDPNHAGYTLLIDQICRILAPAAMAARLRQATLAVEGAETDLQAMQAEFRVVSDTLRKERREAAKLKIALDQAEQRTADAEGRADAAEAGTTELARQAQEDRERIVEEMSSQAKRREEEVQARHALELRQALRESARDEMRIAVKTARPEPMPSYGTSGAESKVMILRHTPAGLMRYNISSVFWVGGIAGILLLVLGVIGGFFVGRSIGGAGGVNQLEIPTSVGECCSNGAVSPAPDLHQSNQGVILGSSPPTGSGVSPAAASGRTPTGSANSGAQRRPAPRSVSTPGHTSTNPSP